MYRSIKVSIWILPPIEKSVINTDLQTDTEDREGVRRRCWRIGLVEREHSNGTLVGFYGSNFALPDQYINHSIKPKHTDGGGG